jgi:hypothetical protein
MLLREPIDFSKRERICVCSSLVKPHVGDSAPKEHEKVEGEGNDGGPRLADVVD